MEKMSCYPVSTQIIKYPDLSPKAYQFEDMIDIRLVYNVVVSYVAEGIKESQRY